ncbi:MAG: hypothetical protein C4547_13080 [Phycisphaerales bacterium]|nr:MAG: hypothetical protein C4547_13080 [Phycisphaerales bacterium]
MSSRSDIPEAAPRGYSAEVRIELPVNRQCLPVAQTGGGRLILYEPRILPRADAEVVRYIDGHERRWRVVLRPGPAADRTVPVEFQGA